MFKKHTSPDDTSPPFQASETRSSPQPLSSPLLACSGATASRRVDRKIAAGGIGVARESPPPPHPPGGWVRITRIPA